MFMDSKSEHMSEKGWFGSGFFGWAKSGRAFE